MLSTILIVILVLMLLGAVGTLPTWPHSRSWGYGPSGGLGLIVVILLILLLMGRLLITKAERVKEKTAAITANQRLRRFSHYESRKDVP